MFVYIFPDIHSAPENSYHSADLHRVNPKDYYCIVSMCPRTILLNCVRYFAPANSTNDEIHGNESPMFKAQL